MTNQEYWWLALGLFATVVVVVAALLGWIIAEAKSIDRHAERIWSTGKQIAGNTVSVWMLEKTNENLRRVGESADSIETTLRSMNEQMAALGGGGGASGGAGGGTRGGGSGRDEGGGPPGGAGGAGVAT